MCYIADAPGLAAGQDMPRVTMAIHLICLRFPLPLHACSYSFISTDDRYSSTSS